MRFFSNVANNVLRRFVSDLGVVYRDTPDVLSLSAQFLGEALFAAHDSIAFWHELIRVAPFHHWLPYVRLARDHHMHPAAVGRFDYLQQLNRHTHTIDWQNPHQLERWKLCYLKCGLLLERLGRLDDARTAFARVLEIAPDDRQARYSICLHDFMQAALNNTENCSFVPSDRPRLLVTAVFWGPEFTALFGRAALPSILHALKRADWQTRFDVHVLIACPEQDAVALRAQAGLRDIRHSFLDISAILPTSDAGHIEGMQYYVSGWVQALFAKLAHHHQSALLNVPADAVFAANACEALSGAIDTGMEAVAIPGLRTAKHAMLTALGDAVHDTKRLTPLALANLHQGTRALDMSRRSGLASPGIMLWPAGSAGMIGHFFHLHPLYVSTRALQRFTLRFFDSIDGEFLGTLFDAAQMEAIAVLGKPDDIIMWELTDEAVRVPTPHRRTSLLRAAQAWLAPIGLRPISMYFFRHRIRFGEAYADAPAERTADRWVRQVTTFLHGFERHHASRAKAVNVLAEVRS